MYIVFDVGNTNIVTSISYERGLLKKLLEIEPMTE